MAEKTRSAGYYELPIPIVVTDDVLGSVCTTRIGGLSAQIHTPLPTPGVGDSPARRPLMPGVHTDPPRIPSPWDWVVAFDALTASGGICLRRVGVVFTDAPTDPDGSGGSRMSRLGAPAPAGMDHWVASLRTWVEVLTEQDLEQFHPRFGASYLGAGLWISDDMVADIGLRKIEPITFAQWQALLQRIADDVEPALEFLLARDARAFYQRGDYLRCAIAASSAAEVALYRRCRNNPAIAREAGVTLSDSDRTLVWLWSALEPTGLVPPTGRQEVLALLTARDNAIRRGEITESEELQHILRTMSSLVKSSGIDPLFPQR